MNKFHIDKKYLKFGLTALIVVCCSMCFYYLLFKSSNISKGISTFNTIMMPVIDAAIVAYILTPVLNYVERKILIPIYMKHHGTLEDKEQKSIRRIGILITIVFAILIIYGFFALVIPQIVESIRSIITSFPRNVDNLQKWIRQILENNPDLEADANDFINNYSEKLNGFFDKTVMPNLNEYMQIISTNVIKVVRGIWNFILGFVISVYMMNSKETFCAQGKKITYAVFEEKTANHIISAFRFTHRTFIGFIVGKIIDSIIIGILCFICMNIFRMPYPVLVSVIVGVTNVIPFFGPYIGAIPSALLILMVDPLEALYFLIFILVLQQIDGNVIGPKILGNSTGLSSFWVIFAITIFGGIFGVPGMIIGVPLFAVIYAFVRKLVNYLLKRKELPTATAEYMDLKSVESKKIVLLEKVPEQSIGEGIRGSKLVHALSRAVDFIISKISAGKSGK